jgi:uncharacterized protein involved in response to NO
MTTSSEAIRHYPGPAFFQRSFQPFFFAAAVFAALVLPLWVAVITLGWNTPGHLSPLDWHVHELIFGYVAAVITGFALTAIPNWTGRLPVTGMPLALLFALWLAGRVVMAFTLVPPGISAIVESVFLFALAAIVWREVLAGKNIRNAPVCILITGIALANAGFHLSTLNGWDIGYAQRGGLATIALLLSLIGGRVVPSFTRNWLAKHQASKLPAPFDKFDGVAMGAVALALLAWVIAPENRVTGALMALAACFMAGRLVRWRGWVARGEILVLILHIGYAWLPVWLALSALQIWAPGSLLAASSLHALTAGAIGTMTIAVMTRASLGHSGKSLAADGLTKAIYLLVSTGALMRVFAGVLPIDATIMVAIAGCTWSAGFALFAVGYSPIFFARK